MASTHTPGRYGDHSREVNLSLNRAVATFIPVFLFAISGYASWVFVSEVALNWFFNPPPTARAFGIRPRHAAGIAIIIVHFVLLLLWYIPYFRILYVSTTDPGLVPLGPPDAEKASSTSGLQEFLDKDMYVCEHGGAINPRWCERCRIWKPDRAHHCSDIDRCVRRMDHFCPWVGGIVSETNHKFFIQFCFYAALYTAFDVMVLGIISHERLQKTSLSMNVHWAVILGICSLFCLFSGGLFLSTLKMALINTTTIEDLNRRQIVYYLAVRVPPGFSSSGVYNMGPHRYVIANTEPGDNPWDLGYYRNWCSIMGNHWYDWPFPIRSSPHTRHESVEGQFQWGQKALKLMKDAKRGRFAGN